ncbi:hypothetical protein Fot_11211 [Forsythia ovata]|uniref:Uncharacterized protein n=1 Tax=Forsythia ovata TaxID=205694 RepID=A0ABD1WJF6_9LAMI
MAKDKNKKLDRRGDGRMKMKCTLYGKLGHNKIFHSSSIIHESENQFGDGIGTGSRAHVGEHLVYSQLVAISGIRQQDIPSSFLQPCGSTGPRPKVDFTPQRRLKATGNSLSMPTLENAWNNLMNK